MKVGVGIGRGSGVICIIHWTVYVTPIFGGLIADRLTGYRKAIVAGAFLMTLGHAAMALEVFNDFYLICWTSSINIGKWSF